MNKLLYEIKKKIFNGERYTIIFSGDSTTSTEWVFPSWRAIFEYVLKMHLEDAKEGWQFSWWNLKFINSGMNGATTQDILERLDKDIFEYNPNMFIGIFGDNDVDKFSEQQHGENIRKILEKLTNKLDKVIYSPGITTINNYHNGRYAEYIQAERINEIKSEKLLGLNLFEDFAKFDHERFFTTHFEPGEDFLSDGKGGKIDAFHPNSLGNAFMAKILLKQAFDIEFDAEMFVKDAKAGDKYPKWN